MSKSVMVTRKDQCFLCRRFTQTEKHHIFEGGGRRMLSDRYGLWVYLCHWCHNEPPYGVHHNKKRDLELKIEGQKRIMYLRNWDEDDFRKVFRKSYLGERSCTTENE